MIFFAFARLAAATTFDGQTPSIKVKPAPSLKKEAKTETAPPKTTTKRYDSKLDVTYAEIEIYPVISAADESEIRGEPSLSSSGVKLTYQLAYKGASTSDLSAAYLLVEAVSFGAGDKLSGVKTIEVSADAYQYVYERTDYKTLTVRTPAAAQDSASQKIETLIFKTPPEDLPQIANAGRVKVKFGQKEIVIRSLQLRELRSALVSGVEN